MEEGKLGRNDGGRLPKLNVKKLGKGNVRKKSSAVVPAEGGE